MNDSIARVGAESGTQLPRDECKQQSNTSNTSGDRAPNRE
jgi:hypothetical protein